LKSPDIIKLSTSVYKSLSISSVVSNWFCRLDSNGRFLLGCKLLDKCTFAIANSVKLSTLNLAKTNGLALLYS